MDSEVIATPVTRRGRKRKHQVTPPGVNSGQKDKQEWPCRFCKRKCSSIYNLERHEKLHDKYGDGKSSAKRLKQFQCDVDGCSRGFGTEERLKRHIEEDHNNVVGCHKYLGQKINYVCWVPLA